VAESLGFASFSPSGIFSLFGSSSARPESIKAAISAKESDLDRVPIAPSSSTAREWAVSLVEPSEMESFPSDPGNALDAAVANFPDETLRYSDQSIW